MLLIKWLITTLGKTRIRVFSILFSSLLIILFVGTVWASVHWIVDVDASQISHQFKRGAEEGGGGGGGGGGDSQQREFGTICLGRIVHSTQTRLIIACRLCQT